MRWAIIDTSVYIDYWERGLHDAALADVRKTFIIRQSSVVLSELRRGARTKAAQHLLQTVGVTQHCPGALGRGEGLQLGIEGVELGGDVPGNANKR